MQGLWLKKMDLNQEKLVLLIERMDQKLLNRIEKRKIEGTMRSLSCFDGYADFYSNDYFGFSKIKTGDTVKRYGSTGSRLISGNCREAEDCETFLADFFYTESALVFNSGYDANLGFFSCIPQKGDTVIYDESIHASIKDGIRLSFADAYSFKHNSSSDLEKKLKQAKGTIYIAIESLYSMDRDLAPLREIARIAKENNAYLIVDEAHACGVFGKSGRGLIDELGLQNEVFARLITFGKAYGSHGACILGNQDLKNYLMNFARSFIYTTALPPYEFVRIKEIVSSKKIADLQNKLKENILNFRDNFKNLEFVSDPFSPIQMLRIAEISKVKLLTNKLLDVKIAVKPIFSPTVKNGDEGIRFCIHSFNSQKEFDTVSKILSAL